MKERKKYFKKSCKQFIILIVLAVHKKFGLEPILVFVINHLYMCCYNVCFFLTKSVIINNKRSLNVVYNCSSFPLDYLSFVIFIPG